MKKIMTAAVLTALLLGTGLPAYAADLPAEGVYLKQDGTPATASDFVPPKVAKQNPVPESDAVTKTIHSLDHSATSIISVLIDEDGNPSVSGITQSSGSIILDQYAMDSVYAMTFEPAQMGDQKMSLTVNIPFHFVSAKVAVPPKPLKQPMDDMNDSVKAAAARAKNPTLSAAITVNSRGLVEGTPKVQPDSTIGDKDFNILSKYASNSVKHWTYTPAENADGEQISADITVEIPIKAAN